MLKNILVRLLLFILLPLSMTAQSNNYKIINTFYIASPGGWDYLAINKNELYVSHGTQVNILNKTNGDSIGIIENTTGVHGIAFIPGMNKGYTSNGRLNNITVFDLTTHKPISQIATGQNPDAIMYDAFSNRIITCNGRSNDLSIIDPVTEKLVATIPVGGKPETAVSNNRGKLYVNIEDKNEIAEVDLGKNEVINRYSFGSAEAPTGLAIDLTTNRLFAGCDNILVIMDAATGKIVTKVPIGEGCDGVAFDPAKKQIYTSNGVGTMTVIQEKNANTFTVVETSTTKPRARTIAIDEKTHLLYMPTAEFEPLPADAKKGDRPKMKNGSFQVLVIGK